jgi:adenylate kinase family enzyme
LTPLKLPTTLVIFKRFKSVSRDIVILHGKPGSGKTSCAGEALAQADLKYPEINHLSVGNHLRAVMRGEYESAYSRELAIGSEALKQARPLDNDTVNGIVDEYVNRTYENSLTVIDGYPKYEVQVPVFEANIRRAAGKILAVVGIEVSDGVSVQRMIGRGTRPGEQLVGSEFAEARLLEHQSGYAKTAQQLEAVYPAYTVNGENEMSTVVQDLSSVLTLAASSAGN